MSGEYGNEMRDALAQDGPFDADKARRLGADTAAYFDARLRHGARTTWISLIVVISLLEIAWVGFFLAFNTKALIGLATLFVVTIVLVLGFSIQYAIASTKIGVLREVKLLRLERLGIPIDRAALAAHDPRLSSISVMRVLSWRESAAWFFVLIAVSVASNYATLRLMDLGLTVSEESLVRLSPDGSGSTVRKVAYRHRGFLPMTQCTLWTGNGPYAITEWLDGQGRQLPIRTAVVAPNRSYTVDWVEPVAHGEWVRYTTTTTNATMATKARAGWTYQGGAQWGGKGRKFLLETVTLPEGSQVIAAEPQPVEQLTKDGVPTLKFQATVDESHALRYTIRYRVGEQ